MKGSILDMGKNFEMCWLALFTCPQTVGKPPNNSTEIKDAGYERKKIMLVDGSNTTPVHWDFESDHESVFAAILNPLGRVVQNLELPGIKEEESSNADPSETE